MQDLSLSSVNQAAAGKIRPFFQDLIAKYASNIHSLYVTGTALNQDYNEKKSDINSIIVLKKMDLKFLEFLAPLGKKYKKQTVSAPLIMTPEYITTSLDVFPIEFLNFKLLHTAVYGENILENLQLTNNDLRHQCERELKVKLIWLRQGYLSSMGDRKALNEAFVSSITNYIPLFRGIIMLLGEEPPVRQADVISTLGKKTNTDTGIFERLLREKHGKASLSIEELNSMFEDYYAATERLVGIVDGINE
ncbi:hypothetical protein H8E50_04885 [bacterium]|nr:hypothetical protein [bacterium]